jgi:hypothetical protein
MGSGMGRNIDRYEVWSCSQVLAVNEIAGKYGLNLYAEDCPKHYC